MGVNLKWARENITLNENPGSATIFIKSAKIHIGIKKN
jgi:hypothetical protein